ncbi:LBF_4227 family protein [Leptospira levettii]|uniref:Uncharacterized protein n=1 Tax=Leptospira levettii TaxID=2023178 RepID=A0AAW5V5D4_9LEPT|nr:hypothetical protein [Leptospira levettii]PKA23057.1 hypothetical protein CH381_27680 [Leptospira sp. mixed culture ATI2-C-A1]MCG6149469.1 hypothetical protein [Leptospira levettii]MCW7467308.1 hypothetical protein [Leptospira levettii]MCW7513030.1 hypothetical protein [Leptospira levettii]MCW7516836.1 hypothetical protein [Leptospira levettii]
MDEKHSKQRKKGGLKATFEEFIAKLVSYIEVMVIYLQKNVQFYVQKFVKKTVWVFTALFLIFLGLLYTSYGIFLSIQKFLAAGDPILASFGTGFGFLVFAILFLTFVFRK